MLQFVKKTCIIDVQNDHGMKIRIENTNYIAHQWLNNRNTFIRWNEWIKFTIQYNVCIYRKLIPVYLQNRCCTKIRQLEAVFKIPCKWFLFFFLLNTRLNMSIIKRKYVHPINTPFYSELHILKIYSPSDIWSTIESHAQESKGWQLEWKNQ